VEPLGAAQSVTCFARNFIELVSVVADASALPSDAKMIPIDVPPTQRDQVRAVMSRTMDEFRRKLSEREGAHRLVSPRVM
jgi:hypothetical protein